MGQAVPLIVRKSDSKKADHVKKKEPLKHGKPGKNKKTSFEKTIEQTKKFNTLFHHTMKGKNGGVRLLHFISRVMKNISNNIPDPLKNKLFAFVKKLTGHADFSEKEKGDILSALLKKMQKKDGFSASLADELTQLLASLEKKGPHIPDKNKLLSKLNELLDENGSKKKNIRNSNSMPKLVVIDLRQGKYSKNATSIQGEHSEIAGNNENGINVQTLKVHDGTSDSMLYFSLKDGKTSQDNNTNQGMLQKTPAGFNQEMIKKLKTSLESEVVKQTKIILKQSGDGEIRIVLKPESLGRIRMRLHLQNNHIDGRIFVENNNIKAIVEQTLDNLDTAFKQEGYDSISLEVSVGNENKQEQQEKPPEYTYVEAVEEFEKNGEILFDTGMQYARVNLYI